jgi:hypothetical protein
MLHKEKEEISKNNDDGCHECIIVRRKKMDLRVWRLATNKRASFRLRVLPNAAKYQRSTQCQESTRHEFYFEVPHCIYTRPKGTWLQDDGFAVSFVERRCDGATVVA